jgi:opacity protein-like surface antigen
MVEIMKLHSGSISLLALMSAVFFSQVAGAEEITNDKYMKLELGYSKPMSKLKEITTGLDVIYRKGKVSSSPIVAVGLGMHIIPNIRSDITLSYCSTFKYRSPVYVINKVSYTDKQKFSSTALMLNGYYDFNNLGYISPYIYGGLGLARNSADNYVQYQSSSNNYNVAIYQSNKKIAYGPIAAIGVGGSVKVSERLYVDAGYRMVNIRAFGGRDFAGPPAVKGKDQNIVNNELYMSLRYSF